MLNTGVFDRALEQVSAELDTADLRLARVLTLIAADRFTEAAEVAQSLWEEQFHDVRVLGYFLFGAFLEQGLESLPEILGCITQALSTNWDKLGPARKKDTHADSACKWLFAQLVHELKLHERLKDAAWESWNGAEAAAVLRECLEQVPTVYERLANTFENGKSLPFLQQLEAMLVKMERSAESIKSGSRSSRDSIRVGFSSVSKGEQPEAADESTPSSESSGSSSSGSSSSGSSSSRSSSSRSSSSGSSSSGSSSSRSSSAPTEDDGASELASPSVDSREDDLAAKGTTERTVEDEARDQKPTSGEMDDRDAEPQKPEKAGAADATPIEHAAIQEKRSPLPIEVSAGAGVLPISPPLWMLMRKIEAFVKLAKNGDDKRASIIAEDVLQIFGCFDPRLFLPAVFSPFFDALTQCGERIEPQLGQNKGLVSRALQHLYEVDLDTFAKGAS